jgi:hypothetical protein
MKLSREKETKKGVAKYRVGKNRIKKKVKQKKKRMG